MDFFGWTNPLTAGSEQEPELRPDQNNQTSDLLITINQIALQLHRQVPLLFFLGTDWKNRQPTKDNTDWAIRTNLINWVLIFRAASMSYFENCYAFK